MKKQLRIVLEDLRRSGDRIGVDGRQTVPDQLAARLMAIARVAASMHLARAAKQVREGSDAPSFARTAESAP